MRLAVSTWQGRVAPVFDVSRLLLLLQIDKGVITGTEQINLETRDLIEKAASLVNMNIDMLICGAVSMALSNFLAAYEIRTLSFTAGPVEDVIHAYLADDLPCKAFSMPGCCGRRWPPKAPCPKQAKRHGRMKTKTYGGSQHEITR